MRRWRHQVRNIGFQFCFCPTFSESQMCRYAPGHRLCDRRSLPGELSKQCLGIRSVSLW
jgi:hypothetical protein